MRPLLLSLLLVAPAFAQDLGETSFANSGAPAAQEAFLRGLLLLHSFEYDDAEDAFQEAQAVDPGFAMAAWGEAMSHNHPVWMQQDTDAARAALAKADRDGITPREAAYLAAADVLFGEGAKEDRDDRFAEAMRQLAEAYPNDLDARSLYALAILGTAHEGRDFTTYMRAAAVAEEVFDENPRHPGAAHYLIHAYDDPVHAPLGLRPAEVYSDVAPAASHALHMPSHIYLALGMWDDVAALNDRSYHAALANSERRGEALNGHGWHALWWWHYAATQLADRALADRLLALAQAHAEAAPADGSAQAHIARIAAQHAVAFDDPAALPAALNEGSLSNQSFLLLADAALRLATGDEVGAEEDATLLSDAMAGESDPSWAVRSALMQIEGLVLLAGGGEERGLEVLREAARLETEAPLTFGPPAPVVPSNEALGYALLSLGRPAEAAEAAEAFEAALARAPNRRQSVAGLAQAHAAAGTH